MVFCVIILQETNMIDINFIRENAEAVKKATIDKGRDGDLVEKILVLDKQRVEMEAKYQDRVKEWKEAQASIENRIKNIEYRTKNAGEIKKVGEMKKEVEELREKVEEITRQRMALQAKLPNPALADVPVGIGESANKEIRKWGKISEFDFSVKAYYELGEEMDLIDTIRAGKVSGTRFGYIKGDLVLLERALMNFGWDFLTEKGFLPILPPVMIKKEMMEKLGYNNNGFCETYCLSEDNLCLIPTAEHALVPYYTEEILREKDLPKRLVGFSTAFRREAGSYGKDTKGILRVHQFNKLEMVCLTRPEDSEKEHQLILQVEEELMQALGIAYHVVMIGTGDLGDPAVKKYDIEAWFPAEGKYRETHSCSNCTDYQARRLNIKFRRDKTQQTEFVHILNGTVFSERPLLAILENYQQKDGSVRVPEALQRYMGKKIIAGLSK